MSAHTEPPAEESVGLTSLLTDCSKEAARLSAEYTNTMYLFVRKSTTAPENLRFQKRLISWSVVMMCSKKMSTRRARLSALVLST